MWGRVVWPVLSKGSQSVQQIAQSNPLPDLNQVESFSQDDERCLAEVAEVLKKHGRLSRFGVNLLHQHFPIADDEVMLETNDPSDRTLLMRPVKIIDIEGMGARTTSWRLDSGRAQMACVCVPMGSEHQHHSRG